MTDMLRDIDAVLFDMDGTLVDSMWIWPSIDDDFLRRYHLEDQKPEGFHEGMEGLSYREVAQYFLDVFPALHRTREEIMDEWLIMAHDKYVTQVPLKEGALAFLEDLTRAHKKIGIATSNEPSLAIDTLEALGIRSYFDSVRSANEVDQGKPSPDVYLLTARDLDVAPERCLVFEDVPKGILAGKNAGMTVCAVEDAFSLNQRDEKKALADYYINSFEELRNGTYETISKRRTGDEQR